MLTHNYFSWSYHSVFSSRSIFGLLLIGERYSTRSPLWALAQVGRFPWQTESLLTAGRIWPKTNTPRIPRGHLHILLHNTYIFPFNHMTVSIGVSCAEYLWLMTQSRVNIQQCSSRWACFDQCIIALLYLWATCGVLSVPRRRIRGFLTSYKSPHLFVSLVFSIL